MRLLWRGQGAGDDSRDNDSALQRRSEDLIKRTILPRVSELVNRGSAYLRLGQVFHGLILAACWREAAVSESAALIAPWAVWHGKEGVLAGVFAP